MARKSKDTSSSSSSSISMSKQSPSIRELLRNELANNALYDEYELLLSDKDLWALMLVKFSPELAKRTQEVSMADMLTIAEKVQVQVVSKDEQRIREGVASVLGKAPSRLKNADYENVTELDLSGASIKNVEFLAKLKNLQTLSLSGTQVIDIGALSGLTNLQVLYLYVTKVTDEQVVELKKKLPGLRIFR